MNNHAYVNMLPAGELRSRLERIAKRTPTEMTSLYEELSFVKLAAEEGITMYAAADAMDDLQKKIRAKSAAYDIVNKCFARIESMSVSAAKIDQYNRTSSAVHLAAVIIDEAITIAKREFNDYMPPELITSYARKLRNSFKINDGPGEVGTFREEEADLMISAMDNLTQVDAIDPDVAPKEATSASKPPEVHQTPEVIKNEF